MKAQLSEILPSNCGGKDRVQTVRRKGSWSFGMVASALKKKSRDVSENKYPGAVEEMVGNWGLWSIDQHFPLLSS